MTTRKLHDAAMDFGPVPYLELPHKVAKMELVEGRLFVSLADGSMIDATDWFSDKATAQ